MLTTRDKAAAEEAFHQAIAVARVQGNRMDALRAADGICDLLWGEGGRDREARRIFDDVYGWAVRGLPEAERQAVGEMFLQWV
jgi:hypothetical protein